MSSLLNEARVRVVLMAQLLEMRHKNEKIREQEARRALCLDYVIEQFDQAPEHVKTVGDLLAFVEQEHPDRLPILKKMVGCL